MTLFFSSKGFWLFSQNENICTRCYYHSIFGSIMALGAIINELAEMASTQKPIGGKKYETWRR
jgi:hypothetical protein